MLHTLHTNKTVGGKNGLEEGKDLDHYIKIKKKKRTSYLYKENICFVTQRNNDKKKMSDYFFQKFETTMNHLLDTSKKNNPDKMFQDRVVWSLPIIPRAEESMTNYTLQQRPRR